MIMRVNLFENESYEQLIKNNLKGEVKFDTFSKAVTPVDKDCTFNLSSDRLSQIYAIIRSPTKAACI